MVKDDEVKGEGNSYTSLWIQYAPRIGKFLSQDSAKEKYTSMSLYSSLGGNPILFNDVNGDTIKITIVI